jgi:hypothetical protein
MCSDFQVAIIISGRLASGGLFNIIWLLPVHLVTFFEAKTWQYNKNVKWSFISLLKKAPKQLSGRAAFE